MYKIGKVNVTVTNGFSNFKLRVPLEWLELINVSKHDKKLNLSYEDKYLYLQKKDIIKFSDLKAREKALQLRKFELIYERHCETKKELFSKMEEHFGITYRTAYRILKEDVSLEEINNTVLIDKQEDNTSNTNVMFPTVNTDDKQYIIPTITIPPNLAILLLEGKTYEKLGIKSASEIYKENFTFPVEMTLDVKKLLIRVKRINTLKQNSKYDIDKSKTIKFSKLSTIEKGLQLRKFESLYLKECENREELFERMKQYFDISDRVICRLLKNELKVQDVENTILIDGNIEGTQIRKI